MGILSVLIPSKQGSHSNDENLCSIIPVVVLIPSKQGTFEWRTQNATKPPDRSSGLIETAFLQKLNLLLRQGNQMLFIAILFTNILNQIRLRCPFTQHLNKSLISGGKSFSRKL